jgi:ribosome-interacting GTPase 1
MPTNLPPDYFAIEKEYRRATTPEEKIALLEEMYSIVPKHKGTDHLRADLRRRLSKLRATSQTRKKTGRQASAYHIDKEGAGQIVIVGPTNVGKSALVAALTKAAPEVSASPYSTWTPTPGMMPVEDIGFQLIDTPPLNREYIEAELMNLIRRADLVLLVVDLQGYPIEQLEDTIALLEEHRIYTPHRRDRYTGARRPTVIPLLVVVNKNDDEGTDEDYQTLCELLEDEWTLLPVSASTGRHFDRLKRAVFEQLEIIRIYSKPPGQAPDLDAPFVMKEGSTVEEFAGSVHQDFLANLKSARVWGSAAHDGQMVGRDYVLQDGDVVELRI